MKLFRSIVPAMFLLFFSFSLKAQSPLYFGGGMSLGTGLFSQAPLFGGHGPDRSAWQLYPFGAFSAAYGFIYGTSISAYSLPLGLQLAHPLNDRFTAFTSVSVAPTLYSFSRTFVNHSGVSGWPNAGNNYQFNTNPRFEMGLQYTNEAKTFSISGSFSVQKGGNYLYLPPQSSQFGRER